MAGARMAARHLTGLGHRRFAVLSLPFSPDGRIGPANSARIAAASHAGSCDRQAGYFEALAEVGVDTARAPVFETQNDRAGTVAAMEYFFAVDEPPTAILAMSDKVALYALEWLRAHDVEAPRQVSVIGFDGVPEGKISEPPLTTIAQPMVELGRRAATTILEFDGAIMREVLPVELVVRGSTAPPPEF
jgi:DNA-binding LacI/PurR family transcriptional regulator